MLSRFQSFSVPQKESGVARLAKHDAAPEDDQPEPDRSLDRERRQRRQHRPLGAAGGARLVEREDDEQRHNRHVLQEEDPKGRLAELRAELASAGEGERGRGRFGGAALGRERRFGRDEV